jgi:ferredoxin
MKISVVDDEPCMGCGTCPDICSEVFENVHERHGSGKGADPDKYRTRNCQKTIDLWPVRAVSWSE